MTTARAEGGMNSQAASRTSMKTLPHDVKRWGWITGGSSPPNPPRAVRFLIVGRYSRVLRVAGALAMMGRNGGGGVRYIWLSIPSATCSPYT